MKRASIISYMLLTLFLGSVVVMSTSCAQEKHACGSKKQKKQKYKSMKRGTSPGGGMLN